MHTSTDESQFRQFTNLAPYRGQLDQNDIGGYYNVTENLYVVGGIENLGDRAYHEHLNQRLPGDSIGRTTFSEVSVLAPGIAPYCGFEWTY